MARLHATQKEVATACGLVSSAALSLWLRGEDTHQLHVCKAGAAAMRWYCRQQSEDSEDAARDARIPPSFDVAGAMRVGA